MQLQQWFEEQRQQEPSALQKMSIYHKFLDKSHRSISYHKVAYYTKVALFSLWLVVITGTAFYSFLPQWWTPYQIANINDAYITLNQRDGQFAQANTIGKIITTQGTVEIIQGTTHMETDMLSENDRVLLAPGAEMHFSVDTNVEAKIVGPAEFVLKDGGQINGVQQYVINLISGDYLEIVSVMEAQRDVIEVANVVIQAPDFTLEQIDTRGNLDVVISTTDDGKRQVENKGSGVVIKKIVEDKQTFVAVQANEKVAINDDVEFIADSIETIVQDIKETQLAVSYQVDGEGIDENLDDILITSTTVRKVVLDETTMNDLRNAINTTFLSHDLDQIERYYTEGNQSALLIAYGNLLSKLQRAHILVNAPYTPLAADRATLWLAASAASQLADVLEAKYYIEPALLDILASVSVRLMQLSTQPFGASGDDLVNEATIIDITTEENEEPVEEVSSDTLPSRDDESPSFEEMLEDLNIE